VHGVSGLHFATPIAAAMCKRAVLELLAQQQALIRFGYLPL
jgi:hypothetical protein